MQQQRQYHGAGTFVAAASPSTDNTKKEANHNQTIRANQRRGQCFGGVVAMTVVVGCGVCCRSLLRSSSSLLLLFVNRRQNRNIEKSTNQNRGYSKNSKIGKLANSKIVTNSDSTVSGYTVEFSEMNTLREISKFRNFRNFNVPSSKFDSQVKQNWRLQLWLCWRVGVRAVWLYHSNLIAPHKQPMHHPACRPAPHTAHGVLPLGALRVC